MRKRRLRSRNRNLLATTFLLFLLLVIGAYLYMDFRGEFLLKDFRIIVEKTLSRAFKTKVSIGDVRGGVFYPITFSDIALYASAEGKYKQLQTHEVRINYHLWDVLFNRRKRLLKMRLIEPTLFILPEEYKSDIASFRDVPTEPEGEEDSFFSGYVQLDILGGSIVPYGTEDFVVKDAVGRIILSGENAELKKVSMNLYGLPVTIEGKVNGAFSDSPGLDMTLQARNGYGALAAHAQGTSEELSIEGSLETGKGINLSFAGDCGFHEGRLKLNNATLGKGLKIDQGYMDLDEKSFEFAMLSTKGNSGEIVVSGNFEEPALFLSGEMRHWAVGAVDLSTNIKLEAEIKETSKAPVIAGTLDTTNTIINYRPSEELSMQFTIRKKAVEILGLKWGKGFRLVGKVELEEPNNIELIALLDGTDLDELTSFGGEGLSSVVSGTVKGRLEIEGPLANCVSRGHITARDGNIGDVYYENAVIHLTGKGPLITIGDSRIYRESGYLLLNGEIDLTKWSKRNILEDVVVKTDDQSIVWEGWDISKEATAEEVSLKKRISEEWEIGFKAPLEREGITEGEEKEGELELKYKLKGHESLKMQLKEEEEFLGVEHKIKF